MELQSKPHQQPEEKKEEQSKSRPASRPKLIKLARELTGKPDSAHWLVDAPGFQIDDMKRFGADVLPRIAPQVKRKVPLAPEKAAERFVYSLKRDYGFEVDLLVWRVTLPSGLFQASSTKEMLLAIPFSPAKELKKRQYKERKPAVKKERQQAPKRMRLDEDSIRSAFDAQKREFIDLREEKEEIQDTLNRFRTEIIERMDTLEQKINGTTQRIESLEDASVVHPPPMVADVVPVAKDVSVAKDVFNGFFHKPLYMSPGYDDFCKEMGLACHDKQSQTKWNALPREQRGAYISRAVRALRKVQ